jgi:phage baseplate assembly protein gpV
VQKTSDCTTNSDGTQTCYEQQTHEIEVSAHSGVIPATFGVWEKVTSPTGTATYHHIAHELNGSSGITEFNAHNMLTSEDGCKLISGVRIVNGSRTDSSRTICPQ